MAKRYCGTLELTVKYIDASDTYNVAFRELNADAMFVPCHGIGLSPFDAGRLARDSKEAYDRVARAAVGFASYDDEMIHAFAVTDECGEAVIRRRK